MRRIAWYVLIVLATITCLVLLWQFRQALLLFLLSLATSAAFRPLIDFFTRRDFTRNVALILSYLIIIGMTIAILGVIGGPLIRDIEQATNHFTLSYEHIQAAWPQSAVPFQRMLAEQLPPPIELFGGVAGEKGFQGLMGVTVDLLGFLGSLGLILILSLYWSADSIHFERLMLSLISVGKRPTARLIWRGIEKGIGAYIRSEYIQSVLAGVLLWLGYRLVGLDYPVLMAVIGALGWLIPWFGAVIAVIPPLLIGLGSGILPAILAPAYAVLVLVIMEHIIEPRIFWRKNYSPVVLVLVVLILAEAYGLLGLILAPLASAAIQIVFKYLLYPDTSYEVPGIDSGEDLTALASSLKERLSETRHALLSQVNPPSPEIVSLMQRLDKLLLEANHYLEGSATKEKSAQG